ncbi:AvrD family protein [Streptomyces sp. NPDC051561]|uniref:AvrD family protein n=1 Tax=Streptomyces sp. NPDC051561 TaxID=3365658 RepID=UPI0037A7D139
MNAVPTLERLVLSSVDDALGGRQNRFFGEGFKRVTHQLNDITVIPATPSVPGLVRATAGIHLPDTWSRKGLTQQRPHLSTIDAMYFAARLTSLYVAHTHTLSAADAFTVTSLRIKAGTSPDEIGLDRFEVGAQHVSTMPLATPGRSLTVMDCRTGSMTVRVEAEHGTGTGRAHSPGSYGTLRDLPVPHAEPFGASHYRRQQFLHRVDVDSALLTADADLRLVDEDGAAGPTAPEATMIDLFVAALQLGQVLLYRLDGLDRATSNTLWMRSTSLSVTPARTQPRGAGGNGRIHAALTRTAELPTAQGTWRTARIGSTFDGLSLVCNVAHLLP